MKKSIFSRYFYLGTIITFFFAALLGSLVLLWADGRYEDEKREQAANMAHLMITETRENYSRYGSVDTPQIHSQFSYYALTYNVSCYLFDENGYIRTGWYQWGDNWFYFDENGAMVCDADIDGYHLGSDGIMQ